MSTNALADFNGIQRRLETELHSWWLGWPDLAAAPVVVAGEVYRAAIADAATLSPGYGLFRALVDGPTAIPATDDDVAGEWEFLTWEMPILYENTMSIDAALAKLHPAGAVRLQVSWGSSRNRTVSGRYGRVREVEGTLTTWVYTPINQGTVKALKAAAWLREFFLKRDRGWIDSCGSQISIRNPDGPRSVQPAGGSEFTTHVITASLTTLETVGGL
jgi:hypothetical protein